MNTIVKTRTRNTSIELTAKITEHVQELAQATDAARMSEAMLEYLNFTAKFHRYSHYNLWLIMLACPQASMVAGYKKWRSLGRYVRKGEKGIAILAPIIVHVVKTDDPFAEEDEVFEKLVGFKTVYVYDVSQTEGKPLPEPPSWKSPEKNALLAERLLKFGESKGIKVEVKELDDETQGVSMGGKIALAPEAGTKTLIHELAHELLHQVEKMNRFSHAIGGSLNSHLWLSTKTLIFLGQRAIWRSI